MAEECSDLFYLDTAAFYFFFNDAELKDMMK